jgi:tRNA (uracil-5-)-methyltransferase
MLSYETQLQLKKKVVEKAYASFSGLQIDDRPAVLPTIQSPKQYEYRTKITPHFEAVPKGKEVGKDWELRIGFDAKGRRQVMDIEVSLVELGGVNWSYQASTGMPYRDAYS